MISNSVGFQIDQKSALVRFVFKRLVPYLRPSMYTCICYRRNGDFSIPIRDNYLFRNGHKLYRDKITNSGLAIQCWHDTTRHVTSRRRVRGIWNFVLRPMCPLKKCRLRAKHGCRVLLKRSRTRNYAHCGDGNEFTSFAERKKANRRRVRRTGEGQHPSWRG